MNGLSLSSSGILRIAVLEYTVNIEPPESGFEKDEVEIENMVVGVIENNLLPRLSTQDVSSGRVEETGVPPDKQDISVIVNTSNAKTSNYTLNDIEEEVNQETSGEVTMVAVRAMPTNKVRQIINNFID